MDESHLLANLLGKLQKRSVGRVRRPNVRLVDDEIGLVEKGNELRVKCRIARVPEFSAARLDENRARGYVMASGIGVNFERTDGCARGPGKRYDIEVIAKDHVDEAYSVEKGVHTSFEPFLPDCR